MTFLPNVGKTLLRSTSLWGKRFYNLPHAGKPIGRFYLVHGKLYDILAHVGKTSHPIFPYDLYFLMRRNLYDVFISCGIPMTC